MNVECVMRCDAKDPSTVEGNEGCAEVQLSTLVGSDGEQWVQHFRYTPYGDARLGLLNVPAAEAFEPGALYRVTFERIEEAPAAEPIAAVG